MDADLTRHTLEVLAYGLSLRERLGNNESLLLDVEAAKLKQMLMGDGALRGHPDYGDQAGRPVTPASPEFLGVRYALACWLDEIFVSDPASPWADEWLEKSLESDIYGGGQERAWRFWAQAELAEKRPGTAAAEAYLWCVMLGFRGAPTFLNPPEWADRVRRRVLAAKKSEVKLPADLGLKTSVPALRGRARFRTAGRVFLVALAAALMAGTFAVTSLLKSS